LLHQQRAVPTGPRDRGVEELRREQRLLALGDHHVDPLELAPLRLVDGDGVGELEVLLDVLLLDPAVVAILAEPTAVANGATFASIEDDPELLEPEERSPPLLLVE
jgi:hypothetical protein